MRLVFAVLAALAVIATGAASRLPAATASSPVLAYRAYVPAMAADAVPGSGTLDSSLVTAAHLHQRVDGGLVVTGEVVNNSNQAIIGAKVSITVVHNGVTATRETESLVAIIVPGATGPFQAYFTGITSTSGALSATITGFETTSTAASQTTFAFSGPYPFQIGPPDPKTNVIPYSTILEQLRGKVTNNGGWAFARMSIVVAAYDGAGNVVFVTAGSEPSVPFQVAGEAPVLEPGSTGSFVAGIPIGLLHTFEGEVTLKGFLNASPPVP